MDAEGLVPVFRAVGGRGVPCAVVRALVEAYPPGLHLRDRDGALPGELYQAGGDVCAAPSHC